MFIKSFRLQNLLYGLAALLLVAAIAGNLVAMGVRALSEPKEPPSPEDTITETLEGEFPSSDGKVVYLTFDDGPSVVTAEILDVLKEEGIPATFFVIGATTQRGKDLYCRIVEEGHALGIHSYSHRYGEIYESADAYMADFLRLSDHLEDIAGVRPTIFRFPGGSNNRHASAAVLKEIKERMEKLGNVWFDWNAIAKDDGSQTASADDMFRNIVKSAGDKSRILILMHDDTIRTTAPECIRMLAEYYRDLGYRFEKLTPETEPIRFNS